MTTDEFFELLQSVWARETSVDEAWEEIDFNREEDGSLQLMPTDNLE